MIIQIPKLHEGPNVIPYEHRAETLALETLDGFEGVSFPHAIQIQADVADEDGFVFFKFGYFNVKFGGKEGKENSSLLTR